MMHGMSANPYKQVLKMRMREKSYWTYALHGYSKTHIL